MNATRVHFCNKSSNNSGSIVGFSGFCFRALSANESIRFNTICEFCWLQTEFYIFDFIFAFSYLVQRDFQQLGRLGIVLFGIISEDECLYPLFEFVKFFVDNELLLLKVKGGVRVTSLRVSLSPEDTSFIVEVGFCYLIY